MSYINTQMWNLKNGMDSLLCKAEIETQTERTKVWIPKGEVVGWWDGLGGWD